MDKLITIASVQMFIHKEKKKNLEEIENHLIYLNKVFPQVSMVVLPELSVSDLLLEAKEQAEEVPGDLTKLFSGLAKKYRLWLIPGSMLNVQGMMFITHLLCFLLKET